MCKKRKRRSSVKLPAIQRFENRVAAGFILRSRTQLLCSAGIGADPQQARNCRFPHERKLAVFAKWVPLCIACRFLAPRFTVPLVFFPYNEIEAASPIRKATPIRPV